MVQTLDYIDRDLYWECHMQFHDRERVPEKEIMIEMSNYLINSLKIDSFPDMANGLILLDAW